MKKIIITVLAFVFVLSLAGCNKSNDGLETLDDITFTGENDYGFDVPEETFEFSFYKKGKANPDQVASDLELMNQYLLDEFNIVVNRDVYDTDGDERLNLMLASGEYPEVLTGLSRTDVLRLIDLGIVVDMAPMMDEIGPNFEAELDDIYGRYFEETGELYGLPYGWGILNIPDQSAFLRYDWYTEMGSPDFETPEEYYELLKEMLDDHPTNESGQKTYAFSWNERSTVEAFAGAWGLKEGYKVSTTGTYTHWVNTTEGYEFTKYLNTIHQDGLLDPDAFTNTFSDWKEKLSNGRFIGGIGPWYQSWSGGHEIWQKSDPEWTENQRFMQYPVVAEGAEAAYFSPKNATGWGYTVITDKATNPEMILHVLNFMVSPMGSRLMAWGVPNTPESNWTFENGSWEFTDLARDGVINSTLDYQANRELGTNQIWLVHPQGEFSDDTSTNAWIDQCFNTEAKWKKLLNENMAGTMYDNSAFRAVVFDPEDQVTLDKQQVEDAIDLYWTTAILSDSDAEFEANWTALVNALKTAGVDNLQEYYTEQVAEIEASWNK